MKALCKSLSTIQSTLIFRDMERPIPTPPNRDEVCEDYRGELIAAGRDFNWQAARADRDFQLKLRPTNRDFEIDLHQTGRDFKLVLPRSIESNRNGLYTSERNIGKTAQAEAA